MVRFAVAALLSMSLVACQGEAGPPGPAGPVEGATSNRYCSKTLNNLTYQYQVVRWASGDVEAICSIATVADERSGMIYYRSGDTGATTGSCWLFYDVDTASGGYWEFRADAPGERATYHDASSTSFDGFVLSYAAGDCTG
jgi:hypothetical protein